MRRLATLLVCAAAVVIAGCGGSRATSSSAPAAKRGVTELRTIGELRAAFNAHPGVPRLIVLASPT